MRAKPRGEKKSKSPYAQDENPELRKVVRGLKSLVKKIVPSVKETVNAWGVATFEARDLSAYTSSARIMSHSEFTSTLRSKIRKGCCKARERIFGT